MNAPFLWLICGALVIPGASSLQAAEFVAPSRNKIIYYGWNAPDSSYVAAHWTEMERMPFDGIALGIPLDRSRPTNGDGSTANLLGWQLFGPHRFSLDDFREVISDLQRPAWTRFTDNFLAVAIATRDQDRGLSWFDDARWATIESNWRIILEIARAGGCRGLFLDPEHYDYECELFNYHDHHVQREARSFTEYAAQARQRGRQLGAAVREVFPAITIGLLYGYTLPARELGQGRLPESIRYALLPAFFDGLLEGSAPGANFVDLWEFGHGYKKPRQFIAARDEILIGAAAVSANPGIYRSAIRAGMSLRIDFHAPRTRWQTLFPERNYFSPARFERALRGALAASDRYVWIYSEADPEFFPPARLPHEYLQAIRAARRPPAASPARASIVPLSFGLAGLLAIAIWIPASRPGRRAEVPRFGPMRILMVTGIFPPDRGGPASYVPKMAAALVRRGHQVEVICLSDAGAPDDSIHAFPVHRLRRKRFWPARVLLTTFAIWRAARRHHLVYVNGLGAESTVAARLAGRRVVMKIVGDYAWERAVGRGWFRGGIAQYQSARKSLLLLLIDGVRTFPQKLAARIIVPSGYLRQLVIGWRIAPEKIQVIPNAVTLVPSSGEVKPLPPWNGRTLLTVCRLVPWKGVDGLIRLLRELPATRLIIAGEGSLRAELETLAQSLGVQARVIFLGDVPQHAIGGYLSQADAFVLNSTYEGLPHVVLEAIAAGTPVIATNAGGTGEIIEHDVTGLLVPVGDHAALTSAVEQLWADPARGRRWTENAAALSRRYFDFDAMVAATEETLRAALVPRGDTARLAVENAS